MGRCFSVPWIRALASLFNYRKYLRVEIVVGSEIPSIEKVVLEVAGMNSGFSTRHPR